MTSSDNPRLISVGISPVGAKYFSKAVRSAGFEPVVINKPDGYVGRSLRGLLDCAYLPADIDDPGSVSTALRSQAHLLNESTIVTSPFDEVFPVIAAATIDLNVRTPDPVFAQLSDKAFVSSLIPEFSPETVVLDPAKLPAQVPHISAPELILKPSLCTGGLGVKKFHPGTVTQASLSAAISTSAVPNAMSQRWLLQQAVDGDMISLEAYFKNGDLRVVGYSRRTRVGATAVTTTFPVDRTLPASIRTRSEEAVSVLASRAGFVNGYFHAEFLTTGSDIYLIDGNMGRLSGAVVAEQMALAHRVQAEDILAHSLLLPFDPHFEAPSYSEGAPLATTVGYLYGLQYGGVIRSIYIPPESPGCHHTRYIPDGQYVPAIWTSGYARIGMISGFREDCDAFINRIVIRTDDGDQSAYCPLAGSR